MNKTNIKDMVRDGRKVKLLFYDGIKEQFIYETECGFEFPVAVSDAKGAIFLLEDKAMIFMRYIRKHIKYLEEGL